MKLSKLMQILKTAKTWEEYNRMVREEMERVRIL